MRMRGDPKPSRSHACADWKNEPHPIFNLRFLAGAAETQEAVASEKKEGDSFWLVPWLKLWMPFRQRRKRATSLQCLPRTTKTTAVLQPI